MTKYQITLNCRSVLALGTHPSLFCHLQRVLDQGTESSFSAGFVIITTIQMYHNPSIHSLRFSLWQAGIHPVQVTSLSHTHKE